MHYTDWERLAGTAAPVDSGEVRGADQLEAALEQYEQLGRELAASRACANAEVEHEVGEKIRTGPKDEFETTAEYNAGSRKAARLLAEERARRELSLTKELAEAGHKQRGVAQG